MYDWVKVIHVLAVISWMAGLLYLPRLMVYHVDAEVGSERDLVFRVMERRLLKAIMRPAGVVVLLSAIGLLQAGGWSHELWWLRIKLLAVLGLFVVHGVLERHVVLLAGGDRRFSGRYFRVLNEVPTVLLIVIVIMVVVKPFS